MDSELRCKKCKYHETKSGDKYLIEYCEDCKKNSALFIVDAVIGAQALVNEYKKLGMEIRNATNELKKFKRTQNDL